MSKHKIFSWPVRVYFQDTDAGGVVYHASYVNFMERARTEWLRTFGYSNAGLMKELGVMFVVRSLKLDYLKPALLDDLLDSDGADQGDRAQSGDADADGDARGGVADRGRSASGVCGCADFQAGERAGSIA